MQLRYATNLTPEQYVRQQAWKDAQLDNCPLHPDGECRFARHGTYPRKIPTGTKIARWYCHDGHATFSRLPDCLCSRFSGTLLEFEDIIDRIENATSQEAAVEHLRTEIGFSGVLRWVRRRLSLVRLTLTLLIGFFSDLPQATPLCLSAFRAYFGIDHLLPHLRMRAAGYLRVLPPPVGFGPFPKVKKRKKNRFQHPTGTDPP